MKKSILLLTGYLLVVALISPVTANQIKVPVDQATINAALQAAQAGDSILVAAGTYQENIIISKNDISLLGGFEVATRTRNIEKQVTVIDGQGGENVIMVDNIAGFTIEGLSTINAEKGIMVDQKGYTPPAEDVFDENFNNGSAGWSAVDLTEGASSLWHRITDHKYVAPASHSPATSWWCGRDEDGYYPPNLNDALVLDKEFDLSGIHNPRLRLWHYLDLDIDSDDRALVDVSRNGGETWDPAVADFTPAKQWMKVDANLDAYANTTIKVRFRMITDNYNIHNGTGWFIDDVQLVDIYPLTVIYKNDFDSENHADFSHRAVIGTDTWERDNTLAHSGAWSYHAGLAVSSWAALQTPVLDFSSLISPQLLFYHWCDFPAGIQEDAWSNGAIIEVATDTSISDKEWTKLYPVGGYPGYCYWPEDGNPLGDTSITGDADTRGFYGSSQAWKQVQFDLSAYAGQSQVWIRFSSGCDMWDFWWQRQWYIDDVMITDIGAEHTLYTNDMETPADLVAVGCPAGNHWISAHDGFTQKDGLPVYTSAESARFCGDQQSVHGNGTYDPKRRDLAKLDNALISPLIDISGVSERDLLMLNYNERRYSTGSGQFSIELEANSDGIWHTVTTMTGVTEENAKKGSWVTTSVDLSEFKGNDRIRLRFRCTTPLVLATIYWYLDDIQIKRTSLYTGTINYCTIRDNQTGIFAESATGLDIRNCTVVRNAQAGIVYNNSQGRADHLILWNNGADLTGCPITYSDVEQGAAGEGNISLDPLFADPANNDFRLLPESPAVGMGAWGVRPEVPVPELLAAFIRTIEELPTEAFKDHKKQDQGLRELEKLFAKHPEKKKGKLLELYNWLQKPYYQRLLLERLEKVGTYITKEKYKTAARKLEQGVLFHMDGVKPGKEWLTEDYREPVYRQGLQLYEAIVKLIPDDTGKGKRAKTLADNTGTPAEWAPVPAVQVYNFPDPVCEYTTFSFILNNRTPLRLAIYSMDGRLVRELVNSVALPGLHRATWDGKDGQGRDVANGCYVFSLEQKESVQRKVLNVVR